MRDSNSPSAKANTAFNAEEDLRDLFMEAYREYRNDVIGNGKDYARFFDDFIFGHQFYAAANVDEGNARSVNIHKIDTLLRERKDLVEKFFSSSTFGPSDFIAMLNDFDKGLPATETTAGEKRPNFECVLSDTQAAAIASIANDLNIFREKVSGKDMANLFSPSPDIRLCSSNNRKLAVLFDALAEDNLINRDWQKVIAATGIITSSANTPLTQSKISSALSEARADDSAAFNAIRKRVHEIAEKQ